MIGRIQSSYLIQRIFNRLLHGQRAAFRPAFSKSSSIHISTQVVDFTLIFSALHGSHGYIDIFTQAFSRAKETRGALVFLLCFGNESKTFKLMGNRSTVSDFLPFLDRFPIKRFCLREVTLAPFKMC
jgi:hypothetical protein